MNRRFFAKLLPAAAVLPTLAAAVPALAAQPSLPDAAAAPHLPLTPAQLARYEKNAPERAHATAHLRAYALSNANQPDFIFFAAPARRDEAKR